MRGSIYRTSVNLHSTDKPWLVQRFNLSMQPQEVLVAKRVLMVGHVSTEIEWTDKKPFYFVTIIGTHNFDEEGNLVIHSGLIA